MSASDRHIELQNMAARWINNRSFKACILPECNVVGYLADLVVIAGMHDEHHTRYAFHSKLEKKYMIGQITDDGMVQKIFGDIDRWYVCVFEIKVSRNDFLNTFGNKDTPHAKARMRPVGTAHWIVAEKGICKPEEVPEFWGILTPYGTGLTELKVPRLNILPDNELHAMGFEMLWLQMNYRTSYSIQLMEMSEKIENVHRAIIKQKPTGELIRLSNQAVKACKGFI